MKKINFENSRGLKLAGALHLPDKETDAIVIISHGFAANKDRERLIKTAERFANEGYAVLRYDFGGSGESEDDSLTLSNYEDDLKSAIKYARGEGYENIGLIGESLGGLASILAYDESIKSLILWSSVTSSKISSKEKQKEVEEKGFFLLEKDGKTFKIPKQYFDERKAISQEEILSKIKCPALFIYGDKDETIPLEDRENAMKYLPEDSQLKIIEGAGHKLEEGIDEVIELSLNWFKKCLD